MLKVRAPGVFLVAAFLLVGTAACVTALDRDPSTSTPGTTPTLEPTVETPTVQATATSTPPPSASATPTATPQAIPTPSATPTNIPVGGTIQQGLFLEIQGISDESVVHGDTVVARGQTVSDAVVSISFPPSTNSIIVPVQADGSFEVLLTLSPGPNLIEVVASNLDGEELSKVLAVVSIPEGTVTPTPSPTATATATGGASS